MTNQTTTIKTRAAGMSQPDEMQQAQNRFAIAVKNCTADPSQANQKELEDAQAALTALEDLYRDGRRIRLETTVQRGRKHVNR